jgi:hypothetical protein
MFDVVSTLNERLAESDFWLHAAQVFEDTLNRQVADPLAEAARANLSQRYLRGDIVDPRTFPLLQPVDPTEGKTIDQLIAERVREATVYVVFSLPAGHADLTPTTNAILYLTIDGIMYWTPIDRYTSRPLLIQEARYQGLDYFSDTISTADYGRLVDTIGQYMAESGSNKAFSKYLGFLKDIRLLVDQLWTPEDDNEFFTELRSLDYSMDTILTGGTWYPTSHVDLLYDVLRDTNLNDLKSLFFLLAPINLVLHRLVPTIFADIQIAFIGGSMLTIFDRGDLDIDTIISEGESSFVYLTRPDGTFLTRPDGTFLIRLVGTPPGEDEGDIFLTRPDGYLLTRPDGTYLIRDVEGTTTETLLTRPDGAFLLLPNGSYIIRDE